MASRLKQITAPNQIIVSEPIHSNIKNKQGIRSNFLEERQLKNVDEPIKTNQVEIEENINMWNDSDSSDEEKNSPP